LTAFEIVGRDSLPTGFFDIVAMLSQSLQNRLPALAALAALAVIAFAIARGRFRLGKVLFHVAVAAGQ
jgi:hypothetical protein